MVQVYFLHQIKHSLNAKSGAYEYNKGIVVKDNARAEGETDAELSKRNYDSALQGYHAYLGAYAYGNDPATDYVQCEITDMYGARLMGETWIKPATQPVPEGE